jgi:hypothetical protein
VVTEECLKETYHLYGDESEAKGFVTYGIVICPASAVGALERRILEVKAKYGVTGAARFHCRELFNGTARRKSPWKHLTEKAAHEVALDLTRHLGGIGLRTTLGIVSTELIGKSILPVGNSEEHNIRLKEHLVPTAFLAATGSLVLTEPFAGNLKLWVDPNNSKIDWFGKRRRADGLLSVLNLDVPDNDPASRLVPENLQTKERPVGLEIADLLAYSGARALARERRASDQVFETIISMISPVQNAFEWYKPSLREHGG